MLRGSEALKPLGNLKFCSDSRVWESQLVRGRSSAASPHQDMAFQAVKGHPAFGSKAKEAELT